MVRFRIKLEVRQRKDLLTIGFNEDYDNKKNQDVTGECVKSELPLLQ